MEDWDDLRFVLAVARAGTTLGASKVLGTSQSTVVRRVAALESRLGVPLFDKRPSGYVPTDHLAALLPAAEAAAESIARVSALAEARRRVVRGTVRFSAPEVLVAYVLPQVLPRFRARYPAVQLELVTTDRAVNLEEGEADVALRGGPMPTGAGLFGRRLAYDRPVLVASRDYAAQHGLPQAPGEIGVHSVIWSSNVPDGHPLTRWFQATVPSDAVVLRPDTAVASLAAIRSGVGLGLAPRFFADRDPELVRAPIEVPIEPLELWILAHERSRGIGPVRQLMDFVSAYVLASGREGTTAVV
ncbi:LysR family transcriptional regulator [Roseomonas populi]|uniref:LysR family transcriptional regulator n=1 Tax=Roseomonas populi TaxID=3121582 RepID=A0ABT1XC43_9PROT|nr:LysR family transcriptional regulator [Roseomonas pecuniae]MCR0984978.1 LysR family transcriptional regulator [Roseomonas pecuniae]